MDGESNEMSTMSSATISKNVHKLLNILAYFHRNCGYFVDIDPYIFLPFSYNAYSRARARYVVLLS